MGSKTDFVWLEVMGGYWLLWEDQLRRLPFGGYDRLEYVLEIAAPGPFTEAEAIRGSYTVGEVTR